MITPAYNCAPFLERAVRSALAIPEVHQVIIAEDGSTDDTIEVCRRLVRSDPRVVLVQHPGGGNRGAGASRNLAIAHATKHYLAFLDADDVYLPERFTEDKSVLEEHPDAQGVRPDLVRLGESRHSGHHHP